MATTQQQEISAIIKNTGHIMPTRKKKLWTMSDVKCLLREDIINGVVNPDMPAKDIYKMHPEYNEWPVNNFPTNLKNLCEKIGTDYEKA
jgi:hypothetical protein